MLYLWVAWDVIFSILLCHRLPSDRCCCWFYLCPFVVLISLLHILTIPWHVWYLWSMWINFNDCCMYVIYVLMYVYTVLLLSIYLLHVLLLGLFIKSCFPLININLGLWPFDLWPLFCSQFPCDPNTGTLFNLLVSSFLGFDHTNCWKGTKFSIHFTFGYLQC